MPHIARSVYDEQCCSVCVVAMRQTTLSVTVVVVVVEKSGDILYPSVRASTKRLDRVSIASRTSCVRIVKLRWWLAASMAECVVWALV